MKIYILLTSFSCILSSCSLGIWNDTSSTSLSGNTQSSISITTPQND